MADMEPQEETVVVEVFSVEYDGDALKSGRMDVRALAPALLALGNLCQEANNVVNGSTAKVSLEVRADFKRGSFDVHLRLVVSFLDHLRTMIAGKPKDVKELLEVLGFYATLATGTIKGVLNIAKRIRRQKVTEATSLGDGTTRLVIEHQHVLTVDDRSWELYRRNAVIRDLEAVAAPLEQEGVEIFRVMRNDTPEQTITKEDLPALQGMVENSALPGLETESTVEKAYEVMTASKAPEHIWRLSDGESVLSTHIDDDEFFRKIAQGELIVSLGDYLRVRIHSATRLEDSKIKTTTRVIRVLAHIPGHRVNESPPELGI